MSSQTQPQPKISPSLLSLSPSSSLPSQNTSPYTFHSLLTQLTTTYPPPLLPPSSPKPHDKGLTHEIANLKVHPTLEVILHILNSDLESAHFLVRHMQAGPKWEGMLLHGVLHRIEGDYDNARAWYTDVSSSPIFKSVWPSSPQQSSSSESSALSFISAIEALRKEKQGNKSALEEESKREIERITAFCVEKFGVEMWENVSGEWEQPRGGKVAEQKAKMVVGGEGWRVF